MFPPQLGAWSRDLVADPIKHQIGTFSIRQLLHLLGQRLFRQGNDVIRAELLQQIVGTKQSSWNSTGQKASSPLNLDTTCTRWAHMRAKLAAQARNVTVPDDFDLGDEVGKNRP